MRILREAFVGLASAISTSLLVLGAITLAMTEGMVLPAPSEATETPQTEVNVTFDPFTTATLRPTKKPVLVAATTQPAKATCAAAPGWGKATVSPGDSVETLAEKYGLTDKQILAANCWDNPFFLQPGSIMVLPLPTATPTLTASQTPSPIPPTLTLTRPVTRTATACSPRRYWSKYTIQPGDNLSKIAALFNIRIEELILANCLSSTSIHAGDTLFVPPGGPYFTPTYPRPPATSTRPPATATPVPANTSTYTPTPTSTFTSTFTATATPSATAVPATRTSTPTPSATSTPTSTFTPIPPSLTPTATRTFTPTGTNLPVSTSTPTATFTPTTSGQ